MAVALRMSKVGWEGGMAVLADVVYHLRFYSIAQDVVIRGSLPGPEYYGLSAESALTVVSEFYAPTAPQQVGGRTDNRMCRDGIGWEPQMERAPVAAGQLILCLQLRAL
jgi:hypothetical protein